MQPVRERWFFRRLSKSLAIDRDKFMFIENSFKSYNIRVESYLHKLFHLGEKNGDPESLNQSSKEHWFNYYVNINIYVLNYII